MNLLVHSPESPGKLSKQHFRRLVLTEVNFCDGECNYVVMYCVHCVS